MKNSSAFINAAIISRALIVFAGLISSVRAFAQSAPDKVEVNVDTSDAAWYGQPWVWATGVAVFVIIIVLIVRNGNRNNA